MATPLSSPALSSRRSPQNHPRLQPLRRQIPIVGQALTASPRVPSSQAFGRRPSVRLHASTTRRHPKPFTRAAIRPSCGKRVKPAQTGPSPRVTTGPLVTKIDLPRRSCASEAGQLDIVVPNAVGRGASFARLLARCLICRRRLTIAPVSARKVVHPTPGLETGWLPAISNLGRGPRRTSTRMVHDPSQPIQVGTARGSSSFPQPTCEDITTPKPTSIACV